MLWQALEKCIFSGIHFNFNTRNEEIEMNIENLKDEIIEKALLAILLTVMLECLIGGLVISIIC